MKVERIADYLRLNLLEHHAGIVLNLPFEEGYELGEILQFPKSKWEEYFSPKKASRICSVLREIQVEQELDRLLKSKVILLPIEDSDYPPLLREIYNPPRLLYVLGKLPHRDMLHVAVVGSREATLAGKCVAEEIGRYLAQQGISVVSGLARGIDRAAHKGVVECSPQGYAIGVVASGLEEYLKPKLWSLYEKILDNGAIISEFPMSFPATKRNFPIRNRIITGIAIATVLVEGKLRSGSMISARLAMEQGRELFAVPGPMFSEHSRGPHEMIRSGANLLSAPEDILADLNLEPRAKTAYHLPEEESFIMEKMSRGPVTIEEVLYLSQFPLPRLISIISTLESRGLIRRLPGNKIIKSEII